MIGDFDENGYDDTDQIRILVPEGISPILSLNGGDTVKMRVKSWMKEKYYRALIRAMPRKIPGYTFMSYRLVKFSLQGIISYDQAIDLIYDHMYRDKNNTLYKQITDYKQ